MRDSNSKLSIIAALFKDPASSYPSIYRSVELRLIHASFIVIDLSPENKRLRCFDASLNTACEFFLDLS